MGRDTPPVIKAAAAGAAVPKIAGSWLIEESRNCSPNPLGSTVGAAGTSSFDIKWDIMLDTLFPSVVALSMSKLCFLDK